MRILARISIAGVAAFALSASPAMSSQDPAPGQELAPAEDQAQSEAQAPIEGELIGVDTEAMALVVRTADGASEQFKYTNETEVSGSQESIAGLATEANSRVSVHFTEEGGVKTATRIEVHAQAQAQPEQPEPAQPETVPEQPEPAPEP